MFCKLFISILNIKDTNDYFEITDKVKLDIPEYEEGMTISFLFLFHIHL